ASVTAPFLDIQDSLQSLIGLLRLPGRLPVDEIIRRRTWLYFLHNRFNEFLGLAVNCWRLTRRLQLPEVLRPRRCRPRSYVDRSRFVSVWRRHEPHGNAFCHRIIAGACCCRCGGGIGKPNNVFHPELYRPRLALADALPKLRDYLLL